MDISLNAEAAERVREAPVVHGKYVTALSGSLAVGATIDANGQPRTVTSRVAHNGDVETFLTTPAIPQKEATHGSAKKN